MFEKRNIIYDEKIAEELDDLSDLDKVSLISDIQVDHPEERSGAKNDLKLVAVSDLQKNQKKSERINNGI